MKDITSKLIRYVLICEAVILCWIIMNGIFAYNKISYDFNPIILMIGITIYFFIICKLYKKILDTISRYRYIEYILFGIFTILAIVSGIYFRVDPGWDMGTCFEIAKDWNQNGAIEANQYLSQFPNNIMMTIIDYIIIKILTLFNVDNLILGITIITALIISLSVILGFYIVKKIYSRDKALLYVFICIFTSPLYLYSAEYYTDTFSMIIPLLILLAYIKVRKDGVKPKKRIINNLIIAFLIFMALKIKLTAAFIFIAIVMYEVVQKNTKKCIKQWIEIVLIVVVMSWLFNVIFVNKIAPKGMREIYEIPKVHWIMMGMNGTGTFNADEYAYTMAPENKTIEDKKRADMEMIKERIVTRSSCEHFKNLTNKLGYAWHDGTYFVPVVLGVNPQSKKLLHEFILRDGKYTKYYKYIPQIMHFSMLIFIFINICRNAKIKKLKSIDLILFLTILGIILFFLIWENRSRYIVNTIPILIIAQINGIEYVSKHFIKEKEIKFKILEFVG